LIHVLTPGISQNSSSFESLKANVYCQHYYDREELLLLAAQSKRREKNTYFQNNKNFTDTTNPHYDRLWKIRRVFNYLNNKYYTLYNHTEYCAVHEVTVKFKARMAFGQYIPKEKYFK
jgi:hypothetical protein